MPRSVPAAPLAGLVAALALLGGCGGVATTPSGSTSPAVSGTRSAAAGSPPPSTPSPSTGPSTGPTGVLASTDGRTTTVTRRVQVGGNPCGVHVAFGSLWVTDAGGGRLLRLDPTTGAVRAAYPISAKPCELTSDARDLWVTTQSGVVDRVDPATGRVRARIETGFASYQSVVAHGAVWVSNRNSGTVTKIDPASGRTTQIEVPGTQPGGLVAAGGALWLGDDTSGATKIVRIDPATGATTPIEVGGDRPAYVTASGSTVWISSVRSGAVYAVDTTSRGVVAGPIGAGQSPVNLRASADGRWVWVPDDKGSLVTRIDVATKTAVERLAVGAGPAVVAPTAAGCWVTNFEDGSVWFLGLGG